MGVFSIDDEAGWVNLEDMFLKGVEQVLSVPPQPVNASAHSAAGITKIDYAGAIQRYNSNQEVYLLYDDGTESLAESPDDLFAHANRGGEFGFEAPSPKGV